VSAAANRTRPLPVRTASNTFARGRLLADRSTHPSWEAS
jgi:hypothetical protein